MCFLDALTLFQHKSKWKIKCEKLTATRLAASRTAVVGRLFFGSAKNVRVMTNDRINSMKNACTEVTWLAIVVAPKVPWYPGLVSLEKIKEQNLSNYTLYSNDPIAPNIAFEKPNLTFPSNQPYTTLRLVCLGLISDDVQLQSIKLTVKPSNPYYHLIPRKYNYYLFHKNLILVGVKMFCRHITLLPDLSLLIAY